MMMIGSDLRLCRYPVAMTSFGLTLSGFKGKFQANFIHYMYIILYVVVTIFDRRLANLTL